MAKYRVVKVNNIYLVQKQSWLSRRWYTEDQWATEEFALNHYSRLTGLDFPNQQVIVESK